MGEEAWKCATKTNSYVIQPKQTHMYTFILLHGLGSNGEKFGRELLDTAKSSGGSRLDEALPNAKFIFPTAQRRRSSAFRRALLSQWFDIASLGDPSFRKDVQYQGLEQSAKVIIEILKEESTLVPYDRIFLGGLSQGCAMSLSVLLSLDRPLGGFVGMSGWLPFQQDIAELINEDGQDEGDDNPFGADENETHPPLHPMITAANFQRQILSTEPLEQSSDDKTALLTPIFIGHGEADEKVHCRLGHDAVQTIRAVGMDVTWKVYPGQGHWYKIPEEIEDILQFLRLKTGLVFAGVDN